MQEPCLKIAVLYSTIVLYVLELIQACFNTVIRFIYKYLITPYVYINNGLGW